jgi:large subunit ribosomal protein L9
MNIILLEDVDKLGVVGDVVDVADGYARNYLIPKRFAMKASKGSLKQIENIKAQRASRKEREYYRNKLFADKIQGVSIDIPVEIGDDDQIYGSITNIRIAQELAEKGFEIDKRKIVLSEPIKSLGVYNVTIDLIDDIQPTIRVWVVRK